MQATSTLGMYPEYFSTHDPTWESNSVLGYNTIYPMPEVHCMAQLMRASDQICEDPGLSPGRIYCFFFLFFFSPTETLLTMNNIWTSEWIYSPRICNNLLLYCYGWKLRVYIRTKIKSHSLPFISANVTRGWRTTICPWSIATFRFQVSVVLVSSPDTKFFVWALWPCRKIWSGHFHY